MPPLTSKKAPLTILGNKKLNNGGTMLEFPTIPKNVDQILAQIDKRTEKINTGNITLINQDKNTGKKINTKLPVSFLKQESNLNITQETELNVDRKAIIMLQIGKGKYKIELEYKTIEDYTTKYQMCTGLIIKDLFQITNGSAKSFRVRQENEKRIMRHIMINVLNSKHNTDLYN